MSIRVAKKWYNCNNEWNRYKDFTSALTKIDDLKIGWK